MTDHANSDSSGPLIDHDMPTMTCPVCGEEMPDFDGIGVIYHEACGYCRHMSKSRLMEGNAWVWRCDYCHRVTA